jgi:TetR/AcrR family transcriptional regulator
MTQAHLDKSKSSGRERLIQAAHSLTQQTTFDEVTIDEIVKAADLSRPTFYYHFAGGKEELRSELVRHGYLGDTPAPDTRSNILSAALRVFARYGVSAATLDDIATEAGISRGALCWHYRTKDELLKTVVNECGMHVKLHQALDALTEEIQSGVVLDDEAVLRRIVGGFYDSLTTEGDLTRLPILVLYTHPEGARLLAEKITRGRKPIVEYVKKRQREGAFVQSIDANFFVQVMGVAYIVYALGRDLNSLLPFAQFSREDMIDQLVSLLLHGIVRRDTNEKQDTEMTTL